MKHFEHLKLKNHKGLKEAVLNDLGKINIICGKNNSGMTTILEAVDHIKSMVALISNGSSFNNDLSWDLSLAGLTIDENLALQIQNLMPNLLGQNPSVQFIGLNDILENLKNRTWYYFDFNIFNEAIRNIFRNKGILNIADKQFKMFDMAYKSFFNHIPQNTILIPSKRNIEFYVDINAELNIQAFGSGILKTLFQYKTQNKSTTQYKIYQKIESEFNHLTNGINLDVNSTDDGRYIHLTFSNENESWFRADNCGMGLQDLLIILYFAIDPKYQILLLEEPENHLHPEIQRKLLYFLKYETNKQYFISTHSNIFLDTSLVDKIYFTSFDGEVKVSDATGKTEILNQLGYSASDNLVSDLIIAVEGPNDEFMLKELLRKKGLIPKYDIRFWLLGGDIMDKVDLSSFVQQYKVQALVDRDDKSKRSREKFVEHCDKNKIPVHRLKKYSMENYIPLSIYKTVFGSQVSPSVSVIEPDEKVETQLGFDPKGKIKSIAYKLELSDLQGTDLMDFIEQINSVLTHP